MPAALEPLSQSEAHAQLESFVSTFQIEFIREWQHLERVARGNSTHRENKSIFRRYLNAIFNLTTMAGSVLGFGAPNLITKVALNEVLDEIGKEKTAKKHAWLHQVLFKNGVLDEVLVSELGHYLGCQVAKRYEHAITWRLDPAHPEKGVVPLARWAARRGLGHLFKEQAEERKGESSAVVNPQQLITDLLHGVAFGEPAEGISRAWTFRKKKHALAHRLPENTKKVKSFHVEGVLAKGEWAATSPTTHEALRVYRSEQTSSSVVDDRYLKYGYILASLPDSLRKGTLCLNSEMQVVSKYTELKDWAVRRLIKPFTRDQLESYLNSTPMKQARRNQTRCSILLNVFLSGCVDCWRWYCHEDLSGLDLSYGDFTGVDFSGAVITGNLSGASFDQGILVGAHFKGVHADSASPSTNETKGEEGDPAWPMTASLSFKKARLSFSKFEKVTLKGTVELQQANCAFAVMIGEMEFLEDRGTNWYKANIDDLISKSLGQSIEVLEKKVTHLEQQHAKAMESMNRLIHQLEQNAREYEARFERLSDPSLTDEGRESKGEQNVTYSFVELSALREQIEQLIEERNNRLIFEEVCQKRLKGLESGQETLLEEQTKFSEKLAALENKLAALLKPIPSFSLKEENDVFREIQMRLIECYQKEGIEQLYSPEKKPLSMYTQLSITREVFTKKESTKAEQEAQIAKAEHFQLTTKWDKEDEQGRNKEQLRGKQTKKTHLPIAEKDLFNVQGDDPEHLKKQGIQRVLLRGQAGIGKTTFCRHYAVTLMSEIQPDHLVIVVPLRQFINSTGLLTDTVILQTLVDLDGYSEQVLQNCLREAKAMNKVRWVLDGYDEIKELPESHSLSQWVKRALQRKNVVLTTRPSHTPLDEQASLAQGVRCVEAIGFLEEQQRQFIQAYFKPNSFISDREESKGIDGGEEVYQEEINTKILQGEAAIFWEALERQPNLKGLMQVPLTLLLIFQTFQQEKTLFTKKGLMLTDLYQRFCKGFLKSFHRKDLQQPREDMSALEKRILPRLANLAYSSFQRNQLILSENDLLTARLDSEEINLLCLERSGLLKAKKLLPDIEHDREQRYKQEYEFIHLTIQEYLVAKHWLVLWQSGEESQHRQAIQLFQKEKYNLRYEMIWTFVSGLIKDNPSLLQAWLNLVQAPPRDAVGFLHQRLLTLVLGESNQKIPFEREKRPGAIATYQMWLNLKEYLNEENRYWADAIFRYPDLLQNWLTEGVKGKKTRKRAIDILDQVRGALKHTNLQRGLWLYIRGNNFSRIRQEKGRKWLLKILSSLTLNREASDLAFYSMVLPGLKDSRKSVWEPASYSLKALDLSEEIKEVLFETFLLPVLNNLEPNLHEKASDLQVVLIFNDVRSNEIWRDHLLPALEHGDINIIKFTLYSVLMLTLNREFQKNIYLQIVKVALRRSKEFSGLDSEVEFILERMEPDEELKLQAINDISLNFDGSKDGLLKVASYLFESMDLNESLTLSEKVYKEIILPKLAIADECMSISLLRIAKLLVLNEEMSEQIFAFLVLPIIRENISNMYNYSSFKCALDVLPLLKISDPSKERAFEEVAEQKLKTILHNKNVSAWKVATFLNLNEDSKQEAFNQYLLPLLKDINHLRKPVVMECFTCFGLSDPFRERQFKEIILPVFKKALSLGDFGLLGDFLKFIPALKLHDSMKSKFVREILWPLLEDNNSSLFGKAMDVFVKLKLNDEWNRKLLKNIILPGLNSFGFDKFNDVITALYRLPVIENVGEKIDSRLMSAFERVEKENASEPFMALVRPLSYYRSEILCRLKIKKNRLWFLFQILILMNCEPSHILYRRIFDYQLRYHFMLQSDDDILWLEHAINNSTAFPILCKLNFFLKKFNILRDDNKEKATINGMIKLIDSNWEKLQSMGLAFFNAASFDEVAMVASTRKEALSIGKGAGAGAGSRFGFSLGGDSTRHHRRSVMPTKVGHARLFGEGGGMHMDSNEILAKPVEPTCSKELLDEAAFELDVPNEGDCLFFAVILGALLPVIQDPNDFNAACIQLFGDIKDGDIEILRKQLLLYDGTVESVTMFSPNLIKALRKKTAEVLSESTDEGFIKGVLLTAPRPSEATQANEAARIEALRSYSSTGEMRLLARLLNRPIVYYMQGDSWAILPNDTEVPFEKTTTDNALFVHVVEATPGSNIFNHFRAIVPIAACPMMPEALQKLVETSPTPVLP